MNVDGPDPIAFGESRGVTVTVAPDDGEPRIYTFRDAPGLFAQAMRRCFD